MATKGTALATSTIPDFDLIIILEDTWSPEDITPQSLSYTKNGLENVTTSDNLRRQVSCSWVVVSGSTVKVGTQVEEQSGGSGTGAYWTVTSVTSSVEASGRMVQQGTLLADAYFDTVTS